MAARTASNGLKGNFKTHKMHARGPCDQNVSIQKATEKIMNANDPGAPFGGMVYSDTLKQAIADGFQIKVIYKKKNTTNAGFHCTPTREEAEEDRS